ncbi:hypothetical protein BW730_09300 [Tessaracoccus aquimaris]|uniref:Uncharacterized protein n=1 Tax=Tessaracoccus aquimaris TaxID=1332264 RepID=A0A1Q2CNI5_9ACTN|nr:hypothetical protein [Tessaracoccus aquimaris]AQP47659.1 hypothetical protein BW730_09300 [Tessaracoccus aquimaris]
MSEKIFSPESWRSAGGAVDDAGGDVTSRLVSRLGSVQITGQEGLTLLDELVAGIVPAVMDAVNGALADMSTGLRDEGAALVETGNAYAAIEEAAAEVAGHMNEGF